MKRISNILTATAWFSALSISASLASLAEAASLQEVTNFGTNPSNLRMHLYVPDNLPNNAPILVANHYCTGTGPAFYSGTQFASLADRFKYIVIYPTATRSGQCFDVYTQQALTRGGGSDPASIVSMVDYVKRNYNVDSTRVFATGASSGAMMTNVLLAVYPDVFKAGAAFAGVPYGCFATTGGSTWNSQCANGTIIKSATEWGNMVRAAYPGYNGERPRMQLWHGTNDETLRYPNFNEEIKQWTNVLGLSQTPTFTDTPQSGYTRTRYGSSGPQAQVEAISLQGVSHNLPINAAEAIRFFGLDSAPVSSSSSSRSSLSSSRSSQAVSSIASSASSSVNSAGGVSCNWYGTLYPACVTTQSGWGWEQQRSCIARSTCSAQPAPFGLVGGSSSIASSASSASSAASSQSSIASSLAVSSAASSVSSTSGGNCNWWGTRYPLCVTTQSGWGWEQQRSCISRSTCSTQPAPYGVVP